MDPLGLTWPPRGQTVAAQSPMQTRRWTQWDPLGLNVFHEYRRKLEGTFLFANSAPERKALKKMAKPKSATMLNAQTHPKRGNSSSRKVPCFASSPRKLEIPAGLVALVKDHEGKERHKDPHGGKNRHN